MAVGAGFASGREVVDFFLIFGKEWRYGLLFGGILFLITACSVSFIVRKHNITAYSEYLQEVLGGRMADFTQLVSGLFFFIMFYAMISASGAAARQFFGIPYMAGTLIFILFCSIVLLNGIKAIENISIMLVPFLMLGIMLIAFSSNGGGAELSTYTNGSVYISAIIYVSYNVIAAPAIIISSEKSKSISEDLITGILCGTAMIGMGLAVGEAIISVPDAFLMDFPLAGVALSEGKMFKYCYMAVFLTAILTTAVCNGAAAADFACEKLNMRRKTAVCILLLTAFPLSFVSFTDFVSKIYPLFGFAGILQLIGTFTYLLRKTKK